MTCLPKSGGCEKPLTDAFVNHLNDTESAHYVHRACLDVEDRTHPQPEALYVDSRRSTKLVIERKSISWPLDYARRHRNDHFVSDLLSERLNGLLLDDLYEVRLPALMDGKRPELQSFALSAAESIRSHWNEIAGGLVLSGRGEELWWSCRRVPCFDREDEAPSKGLQFTFTGQLSNWPDCMDPTNLPRPLTSALKKIYSSCVNKFASHSDARRVLVLDPYEDLRYESVNWWRDVFSISPPPVEIDEVWSGIFDWVCEDLQGWMFERLR
jgi:hypothetical protein